MDSLGALARLAAVPDPADLAWSATPGAPRQEHRHSSRSRRALRTACARLVRRTRHIPDRRTVDAPVGSALTHPPSP